MSEFRIMFIAGVEVRAELVEWLQWMVGGQTADALAEALYVYSPVLYRGGWRRDRAGASRGARGRSLYPSPPLDRRPARAFSARAR